MTEPEAEWPRVGRNEPDAAERRRAVFDAKVAAVGEDLKSRAAQRTEVVKAKLAATAAATAARTAEDKAEADANRTTAAASRAANLANLQTFYTGLSGLAVGSVDRARAGAEVVQKASAAIGTLYTGLLGFVFVASENPLPARGILAPVFLGLAVVLSTAYLAYVADTQGSTAGPAHVGGTEPKVLARLNATVEAASALATKRSYWLRASVVSLGVGLVYIALPFLALGGTTAPATPQATPSLAAWPTPATGVPDALNSIAYKAQVEEVAKARSAALEEAGREAPVDDLGWILGLGVVGGLLTFVLPLERNRSGVVTPKD